MKVKSQLIDAQLEARNSDPTKRGEIVYHTGDDEVKVGDGSGTKDLVTKDDSQTLTNKTLTAPVLNGSLTGSGVLDEDNMASDSDTAVPTQQSVKAYVDAQVATHDEADEIPYDNATSGLSATDVQAAIDEVDGDLDTHIAASAAHGVSGSVVGTTDTQDLSNKTFTDSVTLEEQGSTPSTPASGDKKLYAKNDGKLYTLDSSGNEILVGSGAGGGSKNYIDSDSAQMETGVGSWGTDDGAGSASGVITLTQNTTTPLSGDGDLSFAKSAADGDGHYAELTTQTIDRSDRGKILFFSCNFDASDSNYASNLEFEFYDNTNSAVLYAGSSDDLAVTKTQGKFTAPVYLEDTTAEIEVRIKINDTDATAYTVYFDDFKFGPAAQVQTVYRKSQTIDLTGSGDFTGGEIQVERVGNIVTATVRDSTFSASSSVSSAIGLLPEWARPSASLDTPTNVFFQDATRVYKIQFDNDGSVKGSFNDWAGSPSATTAINFATISYTVPDTTGPTLTENELSLQTVRVSGAGNGGTSITAGTTDIDFTEVTDTHGAWDGTGFTAPKSDVYRFTGFIALTTANPGAYRAYIDGTGSTYATITPSNARYIPFVWEGRLEKGEVWSLRSDNAVTLQNAPDLHWIEISSLPDYTVLGAVKERNRIQTKTVAADATDGDLSELNFSNLVVGRWYEMTGVIKLLLDGSSSDTGVTVTATHDGSSLVSVIYQVAETTDTSADAVSVPMNYKFKATATTLTFSSGSASASAYASAGGHIQLEERNDLIETSDF